MRFLIASSTIFPQQNTAMDYEYEKPRDEVTEPASLDSSLFIDAPEISSTVGQNENCVAVSSSLTNSTTSLDFHGKFSYIDRNFQV